MDTNTSHIILCKYITCTLKILEKPNLEKGCKEECKVLYKDLQSEEKTFDDVETNANLFKHNIMKMQAPDHHLNHLHMLLGCLFQVEESPKGINHAPIEKSTLQIQAMYARAIKTTGINNLQLNHENVEELNKLLVIHFTKTERCHLPK